MLRFILSKLLYLIPTVFGITLVAFSFIRLLPGDRFTENDVADLLKVSRTPVREALYRLQDEGYVRRSDSDDSYRLTHKIRQLSDGFTDDEWISEIANPVLGELLQKVVWPSDLCTIDGDAMLVRETTHRFSPLSFHRAMIRQRMPMLFTAAGRAYLAHCSDDERRHILQLLAAGHDEQASFARQPALVEQMLDKMRRQGYASNEGEWQAQQKIGAIALPIRHQGGILACINVVFLKRALSVADAAQRYLPTLQAAIARIEAQLQASPAAGRRGGSIAEG